MERLEAESVATPGELCSKTAQLLGLEANTTATAWRVLRENSKVTTGGRGRSAAHCVPVDSANLLIAAIGKLPLKSIYASWERYSALPAKSSEYGTAGRINGNAGKAWLLEIPEFKKLKAEHRLVDALAALIAASSSGSLLQALRVGDDQDPGLICLPHVEVRFFGPFPQADISVAVHGAHPDVFSQRMLYSEIPEDMADIIAWSDAPRAPEESGDLRTIMMVSNQTIFGLGELLRKQGARQ
jgi:hypothetical protein